VLWLCGGQELVLRTNVHVVEVGIVATDGKGAPASDLRAGDFHVWDNGREQTIGSFEKVISVAAASADLPPNTYSNRIGKAGHPQVLSMILLDAVSTKLPTQLRARHAVESAIEQLQPEQRVALYAFGAGYRLRTLHDFSSDKESLLAKLRAYPGQVPDFDSFLAEVGFVDMEHPMDAGKMPSLQMLRDKERILASLKALETIADHVKGVPGRKNLLVVSSGFPLAADGKGGEDPRTPGLERFQSQLQHAMAALNNASVSVYPIDARGLTISPMAKYNIGTMRDMADSTGGKAFYNRNDLATGVRVALDDAREVYVLTYSPQPMVADGAYHTIRVTSSQQGVQLRYRLGYYAPEKVDEAGSAEPLDRLKELVSDPLDASEIGIQATLELAAEDIALAIHVDPADVNLVPSADRWTGALRLEAMQLGAAGEQLGGVNQSAEINLLQETYERDLVQGMPFEMKFPREPSAIAVRIGVVDERGAHRGSVSVPLPPLP
jgi:VWFA-related protein